MSAQEPRPVPLTAAELDTMQADASGGYTDFRHALFMINTCHPRSGLVLAYNQGILYAMCTKCKGAAGSRAFVVAAGTLPPAAHCASCDGHACPDIG